MTREQVWEALWRDPRYLRLQERKDRIGKQWNEANAYKLPTEMRLSALYTKANKAIQRYEDAALAAANLPAFPVAVHAKHPPRKLTRRR